jgi:hypothetical protein
MHVLVGDQPVSVIDPEVWGQGVRAQVLRQDFFLYQIQRETFTGIDGSTYDAARGPRPARAACDPIQ